MAQLTGNQRALILRSTGRCVNTFVASFGPAATFRKARGADVLRVACEDGSVEYYCRGRKANLDGKTLVARRCHFDTVKSFARHCGA